MKKLLLLFLTLPFFVASCSSDDKDDVDPEVGTFKIEVKSISYNKISLDWNKVPEAYSYQVFYKAEGASKWETSNSIMPIDNGMTVHWNGDFASFAPDTKYSVQVKAFRDSRESSVMAESNVLEIKTLTEEEVLIVGKWELKARSASAETNDPALTAFIENLLKDEFEEQDPVEFFEDKTFSSKYSGEGGKPVEDAGTYAIEGDMLTMNYRLMEGVEVDDETASIFKVQFEVSQYNLYTKANFNEEEYDWILGQFKTDKPKEELIIKKIILTETFDRVK